MSLTALVHLYRGELGRATSYRIRLDTTTNWAMSVNVALATFTLGTPNAPHILFALSYMLTVVFATIEARRYRELDVLRSRLRILNKEMFAPLLRNSDNPTSSWGPRLADSLENPKFQISLLAALSNRVRRNYFPLFVAIFVAWVIKLGLTTTGSMFDAARIGQIPGVAVFATACGLQLPWVLLSISFRSDKWV